MLTDEVGDSERVCTTCGMTGEHMSDCPDMRYDIIVVERENNIVEAILRTDMPEDKVYRSANFLTANAVNNQLFAVEIVNTGSYKKGDEYDSNKSIDGFSE